MDDAPPPYSKIYPDLKGTQHNSRQTVDHNSRKTKIESSPPSKKTKRANHSPAKVMAQSTSIEGDGLGIEFETEIRENKVIADSEDEDDDKELDISFDRPRMDDKVTVKREPAKSGYPELCSNAMSESPTKFVQNKIETHVTQDTIMKIESSITHRSKTPIDASAFQQDSLTKLSPQQR